MKAVSTKSISKSLGKVLLLAIVVFSCSANAVRKPAAENPWAKVKTPTSGKQISVGFYSAGCLGGASRMQLDGRGYQVMRPSRNRYYGTVELLDYIARLTDATLDRKIGVLLIGDMSQPRGGLMPTNGHASHQIGLDVDIWYWLQPDAQFRHLTPEERETLSAVSLVDLEKKEIKKDAWRPEHAKILEIASNMPESERIFVNPVIKRELCETTPAAKRGWLHKLRPWFGHDDHFHVRLKCPASQPNCVKQDPVPAGDGCGADLNWWFTPEAREAEIKAKAEEVRVVPKLPSLCQKILSEPESVEALFFPDSFDRAGF
jgi:penicillin-insensitive murein endopeptidase